jgi:hypothetical protein
MTEKWVLKCADGETYELQVVPNDDPSCYDATYNLMDGVTGHHGSPITITSDPVPGIAGAELRDEQRGTRVVYLPLFIRGNTPAQFHHYLAKLRKSIIQMVDHQLWVTNEEGQTRVLYCRYQKGFDTTADDDKGGLSWKFVGLYVEAFDPYWYDPPGSEISRNFSQDPWNEDFFTFSVSSALKQDALIDDTRIVIDNTQNFIAGKAIDIRGAKIIDSDEIAWSEEEAPRLGLSESIVQTTNITTNVSNSSVQLNQQFQVSGNLSVSINGTAVVNKLIEIQRTDPNGNVSTSISVTNYQGAFNLTDVAGIDGIFSYIAKFIGDASHAAASATATIQAGTTAPTVLTIAASAQYPTPNANFTVSGTLKTGTVGISGEKINLYKKSPAGKTLVGTATTDKNGAYSITRNEPAGWLAYEADFAGSTIALQRQDPGLLGWLEQLFNTILSKIEGWLQLGKGRYAASSASLNINIGHREYPIDYAAVLTPSMINDGEVQYFGAKGFGMIGCIAETDAEDSYAAELAIITSSNPAIGNNLSAFIDISVVTDKAAHLSDYEDWIEDLYSAGWRNFAGVNSTGRTGDNAYLYSLHHDINYINYNSTPRAGTTTNPDAINSDENQFQLFKSSAIPYIEAWTKTAFMHSPSIPNGVLAGVWANDSKGVNEMLANSVAGASPSYRDLIDWSYISGYGMEVFTVWFHPKYNAVTPRDSEAEQVSLYKSLGLETIVANLQSGYYPAAVPPEWQEPTVKAASLTMTYSDLPLTLSGKLTKLTTGTAISGATITLEELPLKTLLTATASGAGSNKVVPVASTVGYQDGDVVTISSTQPYSETNTIATGGVDPVANTLTMVNTLAHSYNINKAAQVVGHQWEARTTDTTNASGNWSVEYTEGATSWVCAAGEHQFRAHFAGATIGGVHYMPFITPTTDGQAVFHRVLIRVVAAAETNEILSVDSDTVLTLTNPLVNDYLVANECYVSEVDLEDSFLSPDDPTTRILNDNCNLVIFWMRGCPPCYTAKAQLKAIQAEFSNLELTFVEIQDALPSDEGNEHSIGMTAAKMLYPEAYAFAETCGPAPPPPYGVIDCITPCPTCGGSGKVNNAPCPTCHGSGEQEGLMPAVIAVYRDGLFIKAFCGVHTTGVDPVSSDVLEDACGPKMYWRIGNSSIGADAVIVNNGEITTYPIWTIAGPGSSPTFVNVTTGECFQLNHDLVAGEAVVIDTTDFAHTVAGTRQENYTGAGYMKTVTCPTCGGKGVIAATCATCGGLEICPTCHGTGLISVWVPASTGSTIDVGGMYNLRFEIDEDNDDFWGFAPNANVIKVELGGTKYGASIVNMKIVQRYDGI